MSSKTVKEAKTNVHAPSDSVIAIYKLMGQTINTPNGEGLLVSCDLTWNGLYVCYHQMQWRVWYGMDLADSNGGWVSSSFTTSELSKFNSPATGLKMKITSNIGGGSSNNTSEGWEGF